MSSTASGAKHPLQLADSIHSVEDQIPPAAPHKPCLLRLGRREYPEPFTTLNPVGSEVSVIHRENR
jgi:hypothetical protein